MTTTSDRSTGSTLPVPAPRRAVPTFDGHPPSDPVLLRIAEGARLGERPRGAGGARALLQEVWDEIGADGSPLHRCRAAQALARVQDDAAAELQWHLRALLAADQVGDGRRAVGRGGSAPHLDAARLCPELHRDLADVHRRLGDPERARLHVQLGRTALLALPAGPERVSLAAGLDTLEARLG